MTYRERRLRRAERLRQWAEKRQQRSAARFTRAHSAIAGIPPGQPILVGHHSERHHRRDLARHDTAMRAGFEHQQKAASMDRRADEIERQADRAIYDDDPDALEQLRERIAGLEARRDRMKAINRAIRKGAGWEARIAPPLTDDERAELASLAHAWAGVYKPGYPPYALQNLAGNLTRQRQRLARLLTEATQRAAVRESLAQNEAEPTPPEPSPAATLADLAATLNQDAPPIAECAFTLTPPPSGPTAAQQSLWNGPPTEPTAPADAECPLCDGTGRACIFTRASGENVIGACDVCQGTGRMEAQAAAELDRRIHETNAEAIARLDYLDAHDDGPIDDETGQRML